MSKVEDIVKLAVDTYHSNLGQYSKDQADEALRKALIDVAGTDKIDFKTMRRFQRELFDVIEAALDILIVEGLTNQFDEFVEIRNLGWGDMNLFMIEDPQLFHVAMIADGTKNLRRQRLDAGTLTVEVATRGIKIYEELYRFLAGRIDWIKMVNKVSESYNKDVSLNIYNAIVAALASLPAPYRVVGAWNSQNMDQIIANVEAATDSQVSILGTKRALSRIQFANESERYLEQHNAVGHYGSYHGVNLIALKQAHEVGGTDQFIIDDDLLMVVPTPRDKFCKLVIEGESLIFQTPGGDNMDLSLEYTFIKKYGIAVIHSRKLGCYELV